MEIVDAQVHATHRGIDQSILIMDALGVAAAIIDVWPPERTKLTNGTNRYTYTFAEEAVRRFPDRFAYVVRFDPNDLEVEEPIADEAITTDRPWLVIVWNDPVNLMSYVVYVFQKLFGYSREKATRLMLQVHHDGKAAVSEGTREMAEADVARLHAHGLWATMEHPS